MLTYSGISNAALINFSDSPLDNFLMVSVEHSSLVLGSEAQVNGNVASDYYVGMSSGVNIFGDSCSPFTSIGAGASVSGQTGSCDQLSLLSEEISRINSEALGLSSVDVGHIDNNFTISANGDSSYNVASINIDSGQSIIISGGIDESVVINVMGDAIFGSGSKILLDGGILSKNVLFNFVSNPTAGINIGAAEMNGTFLAENRDFVIGDGATLEDTRFWSNGDIIANIQNISFSSEIESPNNGGDSSVNVSIGGTLGLFMATLLLFRRKVKNENQ